MSRQTTSLQKNVISSAGAKMTKFLILKFGDMSRKLEARILSCSTAHGVSLARSSY